MAYTEKEIKRARFPYVEFTVSSYDGMVTGKLQFAREKRDGTDEDITVRFEDIDVESLACIGVKARRAIWEVKEAAAARNQKAYDRVISPGSW